MAPQDPASQYRISIGPETGPGGARLELPFVIGVVGDFARSPLKPMPQLRYRRFVNLDLNNLDEVLDRCAPRLALSIANKLTDDGGHLKVELRFQGMEDFSPERVASQVHALNKLLELRTRLAELRESLQGNDALEKILLDTINSPDKLDQLRVEVTGESQPAPQPEPPRIASPGPVRRNWKDSPVVPAESRPASPPEPGVWSTARGYESASILDQLVEIRRPQTPLEKERTRDTIKDFVTDVVGGNITVSRDAEAMICARIAQIDELVSVQLNEVLHHPEFQHLEACWRGLHFLLRRVRKFRNVKLRLLNVGKKELLVQFQRERDRLTSPFDHKILDDAAGTPGAAPFSLLIGAFEMGRTFEDVELMENMARLCAAAHVPFLAAASPGLLDYSSFTHLPDAERLSHCFERPEYTRWNSFRARIDSRYIGLVLPGMLMRLPYGRDGQQVESFNFEERVDGRDHSKFLWGSAAWALAARFASDFDRYGWCGAPREVSNAGEITDLPVLEFRTDDGDIGSKGPAEIAVSDGLYLDLRSLGLIPFRQVEGTSAASFFETWSCHKPKVDPDADPPTTYESAQINCMIDVSRVAHYLRAVLRDAGRAFSSTDDCEQYLRNRLAPYIVPAYARGTSFESAFPLLDARIRVIGAPDWRGKSKLEVSLLPKRPGAALPHPVELTIGVALPWELTKDPPPQSHAVLPAPTAPPPLSFEHANGGTSGRDEFIHRVLMAEACITNRKLDVAVAILEDLTGQIERYHLDEWESPRLVTHVWAMLRRCYLLVSPSPEAADRSAALLRQICRLDPTRAIE